MSEVFAWPAHAHDLILPRMYYSSSKAHLGAYYGYVVVNDSIPSQDPCTSIVSFGVVLTSTLTAAGIQIRTIADPNKTLRLFLHDGCD